MRRCLELAVLANGHVAPNPMVGAVLVHNDRIIGEGYHREYGQAHAEVNCLSSVPEQDRHLVRESTLYVSLEPCAHFGKTPPCADLVVKHQIPTVVIGCRDPFREVNGRGIEKLKAAGITTITGVLENECIALNKRFFTYHQKQRPYIILKWAQTADGFMGLEGQRLLISNAITNRLVHKWRSEEAAILVGTNTALQDDPELTTRHWPGRSPLRVVIDLDLQLPVNLRLFDGKQPTIVFNTVKEEFKNGLRFVVVNREHSLPQQIGAALWQLGVQSLLVEGGCKTLQLFFDEALWDEARIIQHDDMKIPAAGYDLGIKAPRVKEGTLYATTQSAGDSIRFYKHHSTA